MVGACVYSLANLLSISARSGWCSVAGKFEMVGIDRSTAAHQAGVLGHEPAMFLVAKANRFGRNVPPSAADLFWGKASAAGLGCIGIWATSGVAGAIGAGGLAEFSGSPNSWSFDSKPSSTERASMAIKLALAGKFLCAQSVIASLDPMAASSASIWSRKPADASEGRGDGRGHLTPVSFAVKRLRLGRGLDSWAWCVIF
jgi:hypothetical protein